MKTILSALVALSVIAGVAGSASAIDAKDLYEQVDREPQLTKRHGVATYGPGHPAFNAQETVRSRDRLLSLGQSQQGRKLAPVSESGSDR